MINPIHPGSMVLLRASDRFMSLPSFAFSTSLPPSHHLSIITTLVIKKKLLKSFKYIREIRFGDVTYKRISELRDNMVDVNDIPFTKRWPYRCENEFRILREGETSQKTIDIKRHLFDN